MSRENVEAVRRVIDALRDNDYGRAAAEMDPSVEWHNTDAFPGPKVWGTGKASGAPIDVHWASAYRFRGGKIFRVDIHGSFEKALGAAGLSAQDT